ncbi:hypothetical protein [Dongia sp.]|uniref:hypothetical protein n=1 Tax=Dongia sp. TaxID=1977262 RepID=UPI003750ED8B
MDLNEFIFRDDTAEVLAAEIDNEDFGNAEETVRCVMPIKTALAAVGSAITGASHFLSDAARHL